jgi:hypothetical protein
MSPKFLFFACLLGILFFASCGENGDLSGTATDTENTVAGIVIKSDSSLAVGVTVRLVLAYKALPQQTVYVETITDSTGYFKFENVVADTFNLEFRYQLDSCAPESRFLRSLSLVDKSLNLGQILLQKSAYIKGAVNYQSDSTLNVGSHFSVSIANTTFETSILVNETFFVSGESGEATLIIAPADEFIVQKLHEMGYADSLIYQKLSVTLKAGDTLDIGTYTWQLVSLEVDTKAPMLTGVVLDSLGKPVQNVSVHVVTDLYGFSVKDSAKFDVQTVTNSAGVWVLRAPDTALVDSAFRVEFQQRGAGSTILTTGLSNFIVESELNVNASDTVDIGSVTMRKSSGFLGKIYLVWNQFDSTQDTLCLSYSIKVGFKGTSNFTRVNACASIVMKDLPALEQEVVYYSGDDFVVNNLLNGTLDRSSYVKSVFVNLPLGSTLQNQWFTYSPPTIEVE